MKPIKDEIKEIAHEKGMNMRQVAYKADLEDPSVIYHLNEFNKNHYRDSVKRIAEVLRVDSQVLLAESDQPLRHKVDLQNMFNNDTLEFSYGGIRLNDGEIKELLQYIQQVENIKG